MRKAREPQAGYDSTPSATELASGNNLRSLFRPQGLVESGFCGYRTGPLLIVASEFFIQRGAGEVAEWSKALPC